MDVCPVCQADFVKGSGETCKTCRHHVKIGSQVVRAHYLVRFEGENLEGEFAQLGFEWQLADDWTEVAPLVEKTPAKRVHVERLNDSDFLTQADSTLGKRHSLSFGFRPLGQYAPIDEQDRGPLDFECLAQINTDYPLLGVVRLDVDSLGAVFASGLEKQHALAVAHSYPEPRIGDLFLRLCQHLGQRALYVHHLRRGRRPVRRRLLDQRPRIQSRLAAGLWSV